MVKSKKFQLIREDVKKILIGALIAGVGAFLTFLLENLSSVDFGEWTPFVSGLLAVLVNVVRKFVSETKYKL